MSLTDNVVKYVDGSIGQAMEIAQSDLLEKFKQVEKIYSYIKNKDTINALLTSTNVKLNENQLLDYLEYLLYINMHYSCTKYVEKAKIRLKYNGNYDIVVDNMILKIIDNIV